MKLNFIAREFQVGNKIKRFHMQYNIIKNGRDSFNIWVFFTYNDFASEDGESIFFLLSKLILEASKKRDVLYGLKAKDVKMLLYVLHNAKLCKHEGRYCLDYNII